MLAMTLDDIYSDLDMSIHGIIVGGGRRTDEPFSIYIKYSNSKTHSTVPNLTIVNFDAVARAWNLTVLDGTRTAENGDLVFKGRFNQGRVILEGNSLLAR